MENPRLTNALTAVTVAQTRNGVVMSTASIPQDIWAREPLRQEAIAEHRHSANGFSLGRIGRPAGRIVGHQRAANSSLAHERAQLAATSSSTLPPRCTWATASLMADKG